MGLQASKKQEKEPPSKDSKMDTIIRLIERLTSSVGVMAAAIILPLVVATCYEVFSRYMLGAPTSWAFELGYILTGSHFLLGSALTLKKQGHIRIDLLYGRFSKRAQALVDISMYILVLLPFLVLLSDTLVVYALESLESGERTGQSSWNPPIWPFRGVIAISFVLLGLQVFAEIIKCWRVLVGKGDMKSSSTRISDKPQEMNLRHQAEPLNSARSQEG